MKSRLRDLKKSLVEKSGIRDEDNRDILRVTAAYNPYRITEDALNMVPVIAVGLAVAEYGVNQIAPPENLQRLETLHFLVGWFNAFTEVGVVVIQHHSVDADLNDLRFLNRESPQEKLLQHFPEQPDPYNRERPEESLGRMGRYHFVRNRLDDPGIACIFSQMVKAGQMQVGPVEKVADELVEDRS